jgi:F-type H+-transporting ATPase subunit a
MTATLAPIDAILSLLPLAAEDPLLHIVDHWHEVGGVPIISNHIIMMCIAAVLVLAVFIPMGRRYAEDKELVPTGKSNFFEAIMLYLREEVAKPTLGHATDRYMPLLWTLFFFILFNNLLGLLPLDVLTAWIPGGPYYGTATANIWVTVSLALVSFVVIQISGIKANGIGGYLHHFLGGAPWYMAPILVPVEIMGMIIKPVALAIRLMANMTGGHLLIAILIGLTAASYEALGAVGGTGISVVIVLASVAIMCLEVFVAFLQAYIFTFLTALFIGLLVVHEEHDESHQGDHDVAVDLDDNAKLPIDSLQAGARMAG